MNIIPFCLLISEKIQKVCNKIRLLMIKVINTTCSKDFQSIFFSMSKHGRFEIYTRTKEAVNQEFLHMTKKFSKDILWVKSHNFK